MLCAIIKMEKCGEEKSAALDLDGRRTALSDLLEASIKITICLIGELPYVLAKAVVLKGGLLYFSWFHAPKAFCARASPRYYEKWR